MAEDKAAEAIIETFKKLGDAMTVMARQARVERQMVELLFAISHARNPETSVMLQSAQKALEAAAADATGETKAFIEVFQKRADELLAINQTGFKPTIH